MIINTKKIVSGAGGITDVATAAEMDALLIEANVGKYYRYVGPTTSAYVNDDLYRVIVGSLPDNAIVTVDGQAFLTSNGEYFVVANS